MLLDSLLELHENTLSVPVELVKVLGRIDVEFSRNTIDLDCTTLDFEGILFSTRNQGTILGFGRDKFSLLMIKDEKFRIGTNKDTPDTDWHEAC